MIVSILMSITKPTNLHELHLLCVNYVNSCEKHPHAPGIALNVRFSKR